LHREIPAAQATEAKQGTSPIPHAQTKPEAKQVVAPLQQSQVKTFDATQCLNGYKYDDTGKAVECAPTSNASIPDDPVFSWVNRGTVGIVLTTLSKNAVRLKSSPGTKVKLDIEADSGVNFVLASEDATQPNGFDQSTITCGQNKVFRTTAECIVPQNPIFVVQDTRMAGTAVSALLSRGRNADKVSAQNKVTITVYQWECTGSCGLAGVPSFEGR